MNTAIEVPRRTASPGGYNESPRRGRHVVALAACIPLAVTVLLAFSSVPSIAQTSDFYLKAVAIAAGYSHSLAAKSDGTVWAWGDNSNGQLGDGTTHDRSVPVQVSGLTNVKSVAAGVSFSMALKNDGTVWTWGDNTFGALGDGTTTDRHTPVQVSGLTDVKRITAGAYHALALKNDGSGWGWGFNDSGQIGDGTTHNRSTPVQIQNISAYWAVTDLAAGANHSIARISDSEVLVWGNNGDGQLGMWLPPGTINILEPDAVINVGASSVGAGSHHSLAISWGVVLAWGLNSNGQLGDGTTTTTSGNTHATVKGLTTGVVKVAGGDNHSFALMSDGTIRSWGYNHYGQLGDNTTTDRHTPVQVAGVTGAVNMAAGGNHGLALMSDGTVWAWGRNDAGQLGDSTTTDRSYRVQVLGGVGPLSDVARVAAGSFHSVAVKNDGTVWTWANNDSGQLGDGTTTARTYPMQVRGLTDVVDIAASTDYGGSDSYSLALKRDGTVWAWGNNSNGQLGDGTTTARHTPVQVHNLTGVTKIAAGGSHSLAAKSDGTVWAWGNNSSGQLGDGTTTDRHAPVQVRSPYGEEYLTGVTAVAAGGSHSVAVSDGYVFAWGENSNGQLGVNSNNDHHEPQIVHGPGNVDWLFPIVQVAAGHRHTLALMQDGSVWSWGDNWYGQLGVNSNNDHYYPQPVHGPGNQGYIHSVRSVAAGIYFSLAVRYDGTVWSWGHGYYGQLGVHSDNDHFYPVQVHGPGNVGYLSEMVAVEAGQQHSLALKSDGTVWSWGNNDYGQLGDESHTDRSYPVQVQVPGGSAGGPPTRPVPDTALDVQGSVSNIGSGRDNASVRISGRFNAPDGLPLDRLTLVLDELLDEVAGAGELVYAGAGRALLPLVLQPRSGSTAMSAVYQTPSGTRPSVKVQLRRRGPSNPLTEFSIAVDRATIPAAPDSCAAGSPAQLEMSYRLLRSGQEEMWVHGAVNWQCRGASLRAP